MGSKKQTLKSNIPLTMKCSSILMLLVVHDAVGSGGWGRKGKRSLTGGPQYLERKLGPLAPITSLKACLSFNDIG